MTRDLAHEQGPMLSSTSLAYHDETNDEQYRALVHETSIDPDETTLEQRKRLWWRNAVINLAFIGSWFVNLSEILRASNKS